MKKNLSKKGNGNKQAKKKIQSDLEKGKGGGETGKTNGRPIIFTITPANTVVP